MNQTSKLIFTLCMALANIGLAFADYPERPIRFIVPFPPGGATDIFSRTVGEKMAEVLGKQVVVDNRSGAQGSIGSRLGANANPDGYTILFAHQGALSINPHLYSGLGYETLNDFVAVARGATATPMIIVNPSVPAKNIGELVALAKQSPGKLTFASTSSGQQLVGELFKISSGTDIRHIPYKGGAPAILDVMTGNVTMMFASVTTGLAQVNAGKLRPLAVLSTKRNEAIPNVPTAVEAGYPELSAAEVWYGVVVPTRTPSPIVLKLNAAIVDILKLPDITKRLKAVGLEPSPSTPDEFSKQIRADYARWAKVVHTSGIKAE